MPRFDRTGPMGMGSGTGRGMGPCCGGLGFGRGFGFRRFFTRTEEKENLQDEATTLENELKAIKERLSELKGK